jgi:hypothetical protein
MDDLYQLEVDDDYEILIEYYERLMDIFLNYNITNAQKELNENYLYKIWDLEIETYQKEEKCNNLINIIISNSIKNNLETNIMRQPIDSSLIPCTYTDYNLTDEEKDPETIYRKAADKFEAELIKQSKK